MFTKKEASDYALVKKAIQSCMPQLSVFKLERAPSGHENNTYFVNDTIVVRFPREICIAQKINNIKETLDYLAPRLPYKIATFDWYQGEVNNKPIIMSVEERFKGIILGNRFTCLPPARQKYILSQIAYFLSTLHAIKKEDVPQLKIQSVNQLAEDRIQKSIIKHVPLRQKLVDKINQNYTNLLHMDLHPDNFVIDKEDRVTGVFDFDTLSYGNPCCDLALFPQYTYHSCKILKNEYEKQTGQKLHYFKTLILLRKLYMLAIMEANFHKQTATNHLIEKGLKLPFIKKYLHQAQKNGNEHF